MKEITLHNCTIHFYKYFILSYKMTIYKLISWSNILNEANMFEDRRESVDPYFPGPSTTN